MPLWQSRDGVLMADPRLKQKIDAGEFIVAPGVFDMISAMLAERVGFDAVYASGFWLTASHLGIPDAGLATYTEMLSRVSKVVEKSSVPVIADADTGFGGLLNVQHTVRGYEQAGVSAIQIEDQEFPKKCGHTPYRRVVSLEEMVAKVRVAVDSRRDPNFLVIARTDARTGLGFDEAVRRGQAYAEAGADIVFVEALQSADEMRRACAAIRAPLMANMSDGGKTPIRPATELAALGYRLAIWPAMAALAASAAIEQAMQHLKTTGSSLTPQVPLFSFDEFCRMVGFGEVWAFEEKWKHVLERGAQPPQAP
jgi:2-methylisocitrate lyase-like PEP mutase family enzyme